MLALRAVGTSFSSVPNQRSDTTDTNTAIARRTTTAPPRPMASSRDRRWDVTQQGGLEADDGGAAHGTRGWTEARCTQEEARRRTPPRATADRLDLPPRGHARRTAAHSSARTPCPTTSATATPAANSRAAASPARSPAASTTRRAAPRKWLVEARDREIALLRRKHRIPVNTLARTYGLTRRSVFRILQEQRELKRRRQ